MTNTCIIKWFITLTSFKKEKNGNGVILKLKTTDNNYLALGTFKLSFTKCFYTVCACILAGLI